MGDVEHITTEIIDGDAPVRFVRLLRNGKEQALIPWSDAEAIAEAVEGYNEDIDHPPESND